MLTDKFSAAIESLVKIMILHFAPPMLQTWRNQLPEEPGMRALAKPKPEHNYDPQTEIDSLIQHRDAVTPGLKSKVKKMRVFDFDSALWMQLEL